MCTTDIVMRTVTRGRSKSWKNLAPKNLANGHQKTLKRVLKKRKDLFYFIFLK